MQRSICLCVLIFLAAAAWAEEQPTATEIVVSANRVEAPRSQVASSITKIDSEELQARSEPLLSDDLRGEQGLDVVRSGGPGGNTSIFLRGANAEHTLVLVDGVELNNPINPTRSYNFANLSADNIESVEILRGPQSVLFGSDAMGGVINITTKKGKGAPQAQLSFEGGSFETFTETAALSGSEEELSYALSLLREDSKSISAASEDDGNQEKDLYQNTSASSRISFDPSQQFGLDLILRYLDSRSDLDNFGGIGADDPNRVFRDEEFFGRIQARTEFFDARLKQIFGLSINDQSYEDNNDPDLNHPLDLLRSNFDGSSLKLDLQNQVTLTEWLQLLLGVETEEEKGSSAYFSDGEFGPFESNFDQREARSDGYFAQIAVGALDSFYSTFGVRVDHHEKFGSEVTYRVAPVLLLSQTGTRIFSTVGSGFKAPSLYQLYSEYGRLDLEPEESLGVDFGIEQKLFEERLLLGVTWFHNDFDNLISFEPNTFLFENIAEAETQGFEISAELNICADLKLSTAATLMETEDKSTDQDLLRRPETKVSARLRYAVNDKLNLNLDLIHVGVRDDNDFSTFPASRQELSSYTLVNLGGSYDLHKNVQLFARVSNLFDQDYEEVLGFGTPGVAGYGGFRLIF